ncbi:MAG: hypothetical protein ACYCS8_07550, partial [Acidithiobacillus sp.]
MQKALERRRFFIKEAPAAQRRGLLYVENRSDQDLNRGTGTTTATGFQFLHERITAVVQFTQQMVITTHSVT